MITREAALLTKDKKTKVALKGINIDVDIKDIASMTTITQVFENTEERAVEAVYCFPIEESAAVCGFEIETNGKTIAGKVEEREKAFEIYDKAIEKGDASFLLDQEAQDILIISVGNIKPGQVVTVRISYVSELPVTDGTIRLQIPTTVSPRYAPPGSDPVKTDRITPPYEAEAPYRLSLKIKAISDNIKSLNSPSHEIVTRQEGKTTVITLKNETTHLDRDFILEMETLMRQEPFCMIGEHDNNTKALLFRFFPRFDEIQASQPDDSQVKSEVIFVLDCSGSMQGSSIREAKGALNLSLRSLREGDLFNIIRFGSRYELYSKEPVPYNEKSLQDALAYINNITANLGGTQLKEPMAHVCSLPKPEGYLRDVILLTDGEVSNPDEIIHMVSKAKDRLRVFTFGIGYGASHHLVKGIARASGGAFEMIQPGEKIQPKVLRQFSRLSQPFLTDITISLKGGEFELPAILPPLFEDESYSLFARLTDLESGDAEIVFSGKYLDNSYTWKAAVQKPVNNNTIPVLWALQRIKQLKEGNIGGSNQAGRKQNLVEKEITTLGLEFNIVTDYTSFIAVEKRETGEKTNGKPEYRRIPVQITKDWHGRGFDEEDSGEIVFRNASFQAGAPIGPAYSPVKSRGSVFSGLGGIFKGIPGKLKGRKRGEANKEAYMPAPSPSEWYLELLLTQQAAGFFTGIKIVCEHSGISEKDFNLTVSRLDVSDASLKKAVLITWLAVKILSSDKDAYPVSKRAIKKAEAWLNKNAPGLTVSGTPIEDFFKTEYNLNF
jgi:Ca-activated chloride channel family protein